MRPDEEQAFLRGVQAARAVIASHAKSSWNGGLIERSDALTEVLVELDRTLPPTQWLPQRGEPVRLRFELVPPTVCRTIESVDHLEIIVHTRDAVGRQTQHPLADLEPVPPREAGAP